MAYLYNEPNEFASDALDGLAAAYPNHLVRVYGGVVRAQRQPSGRPALVVGGGSGHYPAFGGWVGPGMAHGAACGNVFASPSASQVYSVARNVDVGGGLILAFGNYAGDVLHFGLAAERLRHEGVDVRIIRVSDDIASNASANHRDRRGIAGDLPVFKIIGAAIEAGANLDESEQIGWKANDATRSFGVAFEGCTLPGASEPLFRVAPGFMGVGLGIHGEPGIRDEPLGSANDVAKLLVSEVLNERPDLGREASKTKAAVVLNGLGRVKYEELFVVYKRVAELLDVEGIEVVRPEVGELVTSLDMAGISLTCTFLDEELLRHWVAPAETPAFRRAELPTNEEGPRVQFWTPADEVIPESSAESQLVAQSICTVLDRFAQVCAENEEMWGRLDAVAGDGDHGRGMLYGSRAAAATARSAVVGGAGARTVLIRAGGAWSEAAGGTSGALWGAALTAAGGSLSNRTGCDQGRLKGALQAGIDAIVRLGGATVGDKTIVDAAVPFMEALSREGTTSPEQIVRAASVARAAAEATAELVARKGRSRVLGERSRGTPDPGAVSFARLMMELGTYLAEER